MNSKIKFYNEYSNIKWVFFDMFDTIVHRKCQPEYIKKLWSKKMIYEFAINLTLDKFYTIRRESEEYLRYSKNEKHDYEFNYEELCYEIYMRLSISKLFKINNNEITFDKFYKFSLESEKEIELDNQTIDNESAEAIKYFNTHGVKVGIISDFYHDSQFINECLKNLKIDSYIDRIFVSCEYRASKSSGALYSIVLKKINIDPNNVIMIGDNEVSDFINAKKYKIHADLKEYNLNIKDKNKTRVVNLMKKLAKSTEYDSYSYSNYSYSIFLFIDRLYKKIKENRIKNIFFLSREGEELKKYFDYYCNFINDNTIKTYYLYVSRVATFLPSLQDLEKEHFYTLFREYNNLSARSFLKNFNISDKNINNICNQICIDSNLIIKNFKDSSEFKKILNNKTFIEYYEINRKKQKNNLNGYLKTFNVDYVNEGMNIVDVGWKGTIQDNLYNFFDGKVNIKGFYLGLTNLGNISNRNEKFGILFSIYPYKSDYYNVYSLDYTFFERLLFASHGSVQSYEINECKLYYPKMHLYEKEKGKKDFIAPIQKNIFKKYKKICDYIIYSEVMPEEIEYVFSKEHVDAVLNIKRDNINIQNVMLNSHIENFGYFKYANSVDSNVLNQKKYTIGTIVHKIYRNIKDKQLLLNSICTVNKVCAKHGVYIINKIIATLIEIKISRFK